MLKSNSNSKNFKVVVPVYNAEQYIGKCLDSLLCQKHKNFTCVVINDCSTDKTLKVIYDKVSSDSRFIIKHSEVRKYALYNTVFGTNLICKDDEDIVVVLDGDDWLYDEHSLSYLNYLYNSEETLATYGGHNFASGGHCSSKYNRELFSRYNAEAHGLSHLRSYKYKLFKKIKEENFKDKNGDWLTVTGDMAVMYPIAEMAGSSLKFIDKPVYTYNNLSDMNDYKVKPVEQVLAGHHVLRQTPYPLYRHAEKIKVSLVDGNFKHCGNSNANINDPNYIEFDRSNLKHKYILFTDLHIKDVLCYNKQVGQVVVAWVMEPEIIHPFAYSNIREHFNKFDYVLTHDDKLLKELPNAIFVPASCTWIKKQDWQLYNKNKNTLLILSDKKITEGHKIKHDIFNTYEYRIDKTVGSFIEPFVDKSEALKDFRFCIISQNSNNDFYFTEHLIDCFLTGTIPVFRGCKGVGNFFNTDGIIRFEKLSDFDEVFKMTNHSHYDKNYGAVVDNFNRAHQFTIIEDYIYLNFIRKIEEGGFLC